MDIMQESFLRCFNKYQAKTVNISLLYKIARNVLIDLSRKEKRKVELDQDVVDQTADQEKDLRVKQEYRKVLDAMNKLETDEKEILVLVLTDDLKYKEHSLSGDVDWAEIVGFKYVSFYIGDSSDISNSFTLYFGKESMGEYNRIKRIIEENTAK